ncbi:hypothetical protein [Devosia sp. 1566]|uniref:hypothetical protein n=1 Tax=Devosia sp. 1566 TaxID=2499144 RepID=UPI000FDC36B4|nr:hypothetical protein [Devosia sp. 1566]
MNMLVPLAALLGIELEAITGRVRQAIIAYAIMGLFGLIAFGFLLIAGYLALADWLGAVPAALICAGVAIVLAFATFIVIQVSAARREREQAEKRRAAEASAFVTTATVTALPALWRSSALRNIALPAAAAAATFLFSRRRGKRTDE